MSNFRLLLFVSIACAIPIACGQDHQSKEPVEEEAFLDMSLCEAGSTDELARAPEGDALCVDQPDCTFVGSGPDHLGCPNTCFCICYDSLCYLDSCTAIGGCKEPPVFERN